MIVFSSGAFGFPTLEHKSSIKSGFRTYPAYRDTFSSRLVLRNQNASFGRKFIRATGFVFVVELASVGILFATPESFSKWDRSKILDFKGHYIETFAKPPVIDYDFWYVNYLGHPLQGAYTYNALRSQGGTVLQSTLFAVGHSFFWEYVLEGGAERPSVQDLIVTPLAGALMGELFHFATVKMSKNGFTWYESVLVCVLNPMYALNNGFKFANQKRSYNPVYQ